MTSTPRTPRTSGGVRSPAIERWSEHNGADELVAVVDAFHAALLAPNVGSSVKGVRDLLADDVIWHVPALGQPVSRYAGADVVLRYLEVAGARSVHGQEVDPELVVLEVVDDFVTVLAHREVLAADAKRSRATVSIYRVGEGRIRECWLVVDGDTGADITASALGEQSDHHPSNCPPARASLLASPSDARAERTRAARMRRGLQIAIAVATTVASLAFAATPALAATPPEPPETNAPTGVSATGASFSGFLNPHAPGVELAYEYVFFYSPHGAACDEGEAAVVPNPFGMAGGLEKEPATASVSTLQPASSYAVCLAARDLGDPEGEAWTLGNAEPFTTPPAPPAVTAPSAAPRGREARVEALVNANNELTECHIRYGTVTLAEHEQACEPEVLKGYGAQGVAATLAGLEPATTYKYQVVAVNEQSRKEGSPATAEGEFTTKIPPGAPEALEPTSVTGVTATLEGVLNPGAAGEPGSYAFLYRQNPSECEGKGQKTTTGGSSSGEASERVPGEPVTGLLANTTYTYCLKATNSVGETATSPARSFTTPAEEPSVTAESFTDVGSSSAVLHATVQPGGNSTSVFFEYGPTGSYTSKTTLQSAGNGSTPVNVQAAIENLTPDSTIHFHAVTTSNGHSTGTGADTSFNTLPAAIHGLPDKRGYELVSPLNNGDATVVPRDPGTRGAADGHALAYLETVAPTGGSGKGEGPPLEIHPVIENALGDNQYLSERSASNGWASANVQPPGVQGSAGLPAYAWFSGDLSEAIIESSEPLTPAAPESEYLSLYSRTTAGAETPLYSRTPPSHTGFPPGFEAGFAGATADGAHHLFEANDALLNEATPIAEELNTLAGKEAVNALYDSTGGKLFAVDVLPDGRVAPRASYGSPRVRGEAEHPQKGVHRLDHVVSADGARIFWTDTETGDLYVRENDSQPDARTTLIAEGARYQTASSDGSKVFFTDEKPLLTSDSTATAGAPDLYEAELSTLPGTPPILRDLTPSTSVMNPAEQAHVMGVLGASEDGSYVYFAAAGALAPGATPQECVLLPGQEASNSLCNVYVLHGGESPSLIATVTYTDGEGGAADLGEGAVPITQSEERVSGDWVSAVGDRTATVTPDGRHLVFESVADMAEFDGTKFDGGGSREIYLYDFGGGLSCVSCNPAGAPALSAEPYARHFELPESFSQTYALRNTSTDGDRVFFNSKEALVPNDQNNRTDVYEWERDGTGTCTDPKNCLFMLSGGTSTEYSAFLDADETGENVFLATRAELTPQDHGETYAVYDARVGAPAPSATTACTGSGCQGVPGAPPVFSTPASATFDGGGNYAPAPSTTGKVTNPCTKSSGSLSGKCTRAQNLKKALTLCHKDKKQAKKKTCEATARKRYGAKAKKSSRKPIRRGH